MMWRRRLLDIFSDVCATVAYAHENGIVHRDLKPDNVMIDEHGSVYVIDWGIAKRMAGDGKNRQLPTMLGAVMGTPGYMAPEQAEGETQSLNPSADVFALGVMLYEILTGSAPFAGKNEREAMLHTVYRDVEVQCLIVTGGVEECFYEPEAVMAEVEAGATMVAGEEVGKMYDAVADAWTTESNQDYSCCETSKVLGDRKN